MVSSNNVKIPVVDDILIYSDYAHKPTTFLAVVIDVSELDKGYVNVDDLKILVPGQVNEFLCIRYIHLTNIKKNFGKISLKEFEENYPEWTI